jgi:hypothetical protein
LNSLENSLAVLQDLSLTESQVLSKVDQAEQIFINYHRQDWLLLQQRWKSEDEKRKRKFEKKREATRRRREKQNKSPQKIFDFEPYYTLESDQDFLARKQCQFLATSLSVPMLKSGYSWQAIRLFWAASRTSLFGSQQTLEETDLPVHIKNPDYNRVGSLLEISSLEALNSALNTGPCFPQKVSLGKRHLKIDDPVEMQALIQFYQNSREDEYVHQLILSSSESEETKKLAIEKLKKKIVYV